MQPLQPKLPSKAGTELPLPPAGKIIDEEEKEEEPEEELKEEQKEGEPETEDPLHFLAKSLMDSAIEKIKAGKEKGLDIKIPAKTLMKAVNASEEKDYMEAMEYAGKSIEEIDEILEKG